MKMGKIWRSRDRKQAIFPLSCPTLFSSRTPTSSRGLFQDLEALRIPNYRDCSSLFLKSTPSFAPFPSVRAVESAITFSRCGTCGGNDEQKTRRESEEWRDVVFGRMVHPGKKPSAPASLVFYHVLLAMGHRHARPHIAICWFPSR